MKRKLMLLLACLFVGIGLVTAQTQTITGVVISEEDGQPVIGASVLVKGTQLGTITGVDGDFTLSNVPSSAKTLQISFIGMQTQEVAVKPNLKVVMRGNAEALDEVVVIAYGTAKKESLTGSISVVDNKKIEKRITTSVTGALEGAAPGVQVNNTYGEPGQAPEIRIRGFGTLAAAEDAAAAAKDAAAAVTEATGGTEQTEENRKRTQAIQQMARAAGLSADYALALVGTDLTVEQCSTAIMRRLAKRSQENGVNGNHSVRATGLDAGTKKRMAVENALLHRIYPSKFSLDAGAREFRGMTMVEIGRELLSERGINTRGLDRSEVAKMVFNRAHSTSDFPLLG